MILIISYIDSPYGCQRADNWRGLLPVPWIALFFAGVSVCGVACLFPRLPNRDLVDTGDDRW